MRCPMSDLIDLQYSCTEPFEATVPFLYLDPKGLVTCGIGYYLPNKDALKEFVWEPDGLSGAEVDYLVVKASDKGMGVSYYRRLTHARMTPESIRNGFHRRIVKIRKELEVDWGLSQLPLDAQLVLVDMAYNAGIGGLKRYVNLRQSVWARDWTRASQETRMKGIQESRNQWRQQTLLNLSK